MVTKERKMIVVDYKEVMKSVEGLDYEQLLRVTQDALKRVRPVLKLVDIENRGLLLFLNIICASIGADGELSELEKRFVCDAFSLEEDILEELIKFSGDEELVDKLADSVSEDVKKDIVVIVCAIAACDKNMSRNDEAFIEKIIR